MGQEKLRKASDPDYGKYSSSVRGLIVSNPTTINANGGITVNSGSLDAQELRSSLLYWDRLAFPRNRAVLVSGGYDVQELVQCGVMETPMIDVPRSGHVATIVTAAQASALEYYEQRSPGTWSIGEGVNSIKSDAGHGRGGTGLEIYNALPVPADHVPLVEILDFKERRRTELMMFRAHMDAMCKTITSADDSGEALSQALKELDLACADLIAVTREWQFPVRLCNLKASVNFNFAKSASAAAAAWKAAETLTLGKTEQLVAASIAGVTSNFKVSADFEFQRLKRPASPYKYLYQATRELV